MVELTLNILISPIWLITDLKGVNLNLYYLKKRNL